MKEIITATITIDLKNTKKKRDEIIAWLHSKAEEIKNLDDSKYINKPSWNLNGYKE